MTSVVITESTPGSGSQPLRRSARIANMNAQASAVVRSPVILEEKIVWAPSTRTRRSSADAIEDDALKPHTKAKTKPPLQKKKKKKKSASSASPADSSTAQTQGDGSSRRKKPRPARRGHGRARNREANKGTGEEREGCSTATNSITIQLSTKDRYANVETSVTVVAVSAVQVQVKSRPGKNIEPADETERRVEIRNTPRPGFGLGNRSVVDDMSDDGEESLLARAYGEAVRFMDK